MNQHYSSTKKLSLQEKIEAHVMVRSNESHDNRCKIIQKQFAFMSEVSDDQFREKLIEHYRGLFTSTIKDLFQLHLRPNSVLEPRDVENRVNTILSIVNDILSGNSKYNSFLESEESIEFILSSKTFPKAVVMLTFTLIVPDDISIPNVVQTGDELLVMNSFTGNYTPYGTRH